MKRLTHILALTLTLSLAYRGEAADQYPSYPITYPADAIKVPSGGDVGKALATGKTVLVKFGGKYMNLAPLSLKNGQTLGVYGDGRDGWADFFCPLGGFAITERKGVTIQGIGLRGSGIKAVGVRLLNVTDFRMLNSGVTGFGSFGILCEGYKARNRNVLFNGVRVADNFPATGGLCSGIFASYTDGLTLANGVYDNNGHTKDDEAAKRNHNAYISATCGPIVAFGNIFSNASSHGLQARSGGDISYCVFYNNPLGLSYGMVNGDKCFAGGVSGDVHHLVFSGGGDINGDARGWPIEISNVKDAKFHDIIVCDDMKATGEAIQISDCSRLTNPRDYVKIQKLGIDRVTVWNFKRAPITPLKEIAKLGKPTMTNVGLRPPKPTDMKQVLGSDFIKVVRLAPTGKGKVYADKAFAAIATSN